MTENTLKKDVVNHPEHYKSKSGIEVIDVIEAFTYGLEGIEATDTGNIIKYICRWKKKNGIEDLKKAQWYLNHLVEHIEGNVVPELCWDMPIFERRIDAETVLYEMENLIESYGFVTVGDMFYLAELSSPCNAFKYGWTNIEEAQVIRVRSGYSLRLPRVFFLDGITILNKSEEKENK